MATDKLRLRDFIDYLKKSPLAVMLALITLITLLLGLIYQIIDRPHVALVVLCVLGSVLLFAYNIWIVDARKSPRSKKRLFPKKLRISIHMMSFCVFLVCWIVVPYMASNRRGGYALLKLGRSKLAAKRLTEYLKSRPDDKIAWCRLARAKLKLEEKEHAEIEEVIRKGPTDADVCYWQGRIYDADGNFQEAVRKYKESFQRDTKYAAKAYPRYIAGLFKIAEEQSKDSDERLLQLERALGYANDAIGVTKSLKDESMLENIQGWKARTLNDLAYIYAERGEKFKQAETFICEALDIAKSLKGSGYAYCLDTKAWVIIKKAESSNLGPTGEEYKEAEALIIKALKLLPADDMNREHIKDHLRHVKRLLSTETNVP